VLRPPLVIRASLPALSVHILDLALQRPSLRDDAARLLVDGFREPSGWRTLEAARAAVAHVIDAGFARAAVERDVLLGWVGGLPEYEGRVWDLHPLVVRPERRRAGLGRALVAAFEAEARARGAFTATLGTDDDAGMTSLAHTDLYGDIPGHIARIRDLGRNHPFVFYQKLGYAITGVLPDANGPGRPDIYMSKSLR
jgi:aminoglycoside 6'-N-acetyltransferase I